MPKSKYRLLSPVRVGGKLRKPASGKDVTVALDENDAEALLALGAVAPAGGAKPSDETEATELEQLVGKQAAAALAAGGVESVSQAYDASDDALLAIDGVGAGTVKKIREAQAAAAEQQGEA